MGLKHVGVAAFRSDASVLVISNVDALVGVKRNGASPLDKSNLNWRDEAARAINHPAVNCVADSAVLLSMSLLCSQQESLLFSKDVDFLDAALDLFTRLKEERAGTSHENLLSKLVLALLILRVLDVAEFIVSKDSDRLGLDELFVHIDDMN